MAGDFVHKKLQVHAVGIVFAADKAMVFAWAWLAEDRVSV
jgi:hypothetical protein